MIMTLLVHNQSGAHQRNYEGITRTLRSAVRETDGIAITLIKNEPWINMANQTRCQNTGARLRSKGKS